MGQEGVPVDSSERTIVDNWARDVCQSNRRGAIFSQITSYCSFEEPRRSIISRQWGKSFIQTSSLHALLSVYSTLTTNGITRSKKRRRSRLEVKYDGFLFVYCSIVTRQIRRSRETLERPSSSLI